MTVTWLVLGLAGCGGPEPLLFGRGSTLCELDQSPLRLDERGVGGFTPRELLDHARLELSELHVDWQEGREPSSDVFTTVFDEPTAAREISTRGEREVCAVTTWVEVDTPTSTANADATVVAEGIATLKAIRLEADEVYVDASLPAVLSGDYLATAEAEFDTIDETYVGAGTDFMWWEPHQNWSVSAMGSTPEAYSRGSVYRCHEDDEVDCLRPASFAE